MTRKKGLGQRFVCTFLFGDEKPQTKSQDTKNLTLF